MFSAPDIKIPQDKKKQRSKMVSSRFLRSGRCISYGLFVLLVLSVVFIFLDESKVSQIRQRLRINVTGSGSLMILGRVNQMLDGSEKVKVLQWSGQWVENFEVCDSSHPPASVVSYRLYSGKLPFVLYGVGNSEDESLYRKMSELSYRFSMKVDDFISMYLENYPRTTFVDIGASVGVTSLRMARKGHHVISVESDRENIRGLCMSVAENKVMENMTIVYHSVGIEDFTSVLPGEQKAEPHTITVDKVLSLSNRNVLVKIDTDGSEHTVILGSKLLLMSKRTRAIVIAWETHKGQKSGEDMLSLFNAWGFHPHAFRGSGSVRLDTKARAPSFWPSDVIFLPVE